MLLITTRVAFLAVALLSLTPNVNAGPGFPRGPGLYLNLFTFALVLLVYFGWLRLCSWVDEDARRLDLDRTRWNSLVVGGGALGLLLLWIVPWFPIAFPALLLLLLLPMIFYVRMRNALVAESQQVFTEQHLRKLAGRFSPQRVNPPPEAPDGPEVHFLPTPSELPGQERPRVRRAQRLRGYRPALELVCDAVQRRATELHLEPTQEKTTLRLQIDGVYHDMASLPRSKTDAIAEVIKTWGGLDPAEWSRSQQGDFVAEIDGGQVDFRARTDPSGEREHLTLTIADQAQRILRFDELGMPARIRDALGEALGVASGLVLVCGPEKSGRTSTAYSCLHVLDRMRRRIMTIEDPIHQRVARFEQIALNRAAGESTASALRRLTPGMGPRTLFIGAIEDAETAELAVQKAEEGRLILGIVRGHDAVTGLYRLIELGVPPGRVAGVTLGVLCQRLIRLLCEQCKVRYRPDPEAVRRANLLPERVQQLYRIPEEAELKRDKAGQVVPCPSCRGIGFRGRTGVYEFLHITERMRALLQQNSPMAQLKQEAVKNGMNYLQDEALELVFRGRTSIPEMIQVLKE